jgi:hypothetical protein
MKKQIFTILAMFFIAFTASAATLVIQDEQTFDWLMYLGNFAVYTAAILPATGYLKQWLKVSDDKARWLSWAVAIVIAFAAWVFNLGYFAELTNWKVTLVTGLIGGLAANGVFKLSFAQAILQVIGAQLKK